MRCFSMSSANMFLTQPFPVFMGLFLLIVTGMLLIFVWSCLPLKVPVREIHSHHWANRQPGPEGEEERTQGVSPHRIEQIKPLPRGARPVSSPSTSTASFALAAEPGPQ